jgi:hypothetical protein
MRPDKSRDETNTEVNTDTEVQMLNLGYLAVDRGLSTVDFLILNDLTAF